MRPIDDGMAPVRAVRAAISRECGHDPRRYLTHLRAQQKRFARQVAAYRRRHRPEKAIAAGRDA